MEFCAEGNLVLLDQASIPRFFYGTAWKESQTQRLTELAIEQGFRAIDTANQRRHYDEAAVGRAIAAALDRGVVTREELFLQTKYTFQRGQDHRLPYDPRASVPVQVEQSFGSSLEHLGVEQVDSYLLHGPSQRVGLTADDWSAWRAMETIQTAGRARLIGVSNVTLEQLQLFCAEARVTPRVVQNRCYASQGWDRGVREFCRASGIHYQGFSLLTANTATLAHPVVTAIAKTHHKTPAQIVFCLALEIGIVPLTGTSSAEHMRADLDMLKFRLPPEDVERIEHLGDGLQNR